MKKIVAIVGPSASGKNTLLKKLKKYLLDYNFVVHSTTRPKRDGEIEDINYHFLTEKEMYDKIFNGDMINAANYRDWVYALEYDELKDDKINIGDFNLADLEELNINKNIELYVIYMTAKSKVRFIRCLEREEEPDISEIYRRYLSDDEDFYWFEEDLKNNVYKNFIIIDTSNNDIDYNKINSFLNEVE